ncbi:ABC transporter ATP-binding protein [Streptococcus sp. ZJ93]|uniref:ABC transporter ATP-binding protein n=1 Tax=Streptococcus handemini TaxID=3161188 RepID=UPI0032EE4F54
MAREEGNVKVIVENVSKVFEMENNEFVALKDVQLEIEENDFITAVGPSGCGKSTLLNIIAGMIPPTSGRVVCNNQIVTGMSPDRGVIFQQYALFPWLTVKQNVMFGLNVQGFEKSEAESVADKYIQMVGLEKFSHHFPKELSGGMKQRVAIARAYAANPSVLLMDEPFGAVDPLARAQLQVELLNMWIKERKTCFFITHDIEEAIFLGTKIAIMGTNPGNIKELMHIPLPHSRRLGIKNEKEFLEIKEYVWSQVYGESQYEME